MPDITKLRWRVGRRVGRTIYVQLGLEPNDQVDVLIGMLDDRELAAEAVEAHNAHQAEAIARYEGWLRQNGDVA